MTNEEAKKAEKELNALLNMCNPSPLTKELEDALKLAIKALEQQPCEDTEVIKVSKGAVKARQGRFVIYDVEWLKENFYTTEEKIYGQPKQPCEDCISREYIEPIVEELENICINGDEYILSLLSSIKNAPSVTPQPKKGHWINLENTKYKGMVLPFWSRYECSKCGGHGEGTFNYCPNCGCKMIEVE